MRRPGLETRRRPGDRPVAVRVVLEGDLELVAGALRGGLHLEARDVALPLEDRRRGTPSASSSASSPCRAWPCWRCGVGSACPQSGLSLSRSLPSPHQLALVTPGISPACTSSRRQIRQRPNLLEHRLRTAASPAPGVAPDLVLGLALLLLDKCLLGHGAKRPPAGKGTRTRRERRGPARLSGLWCRWLCPCPVVVSTRS